MAENMERAGMQGETGPDVPAAVRRSVEEAIAGSYGSPQEPQLYIVTIHGPSHASDWNRYVVQGESERLISGTADPVNLNAQSPMHPSDPPGHSTGADEEAESLLETALDSVRRFKAMLSDTSTTLDRMSGKAHEISAAYRAERAC